MNREDTYHVTLRQWFVHALPPEWLVVHIPNNPRSKAAGARLQRLGMRAGMPDLMLLGPDREVYFAEIKCDRDPRGMRTYLSTEQHKIHAALRSLGHVPGVLRSIADAEDWAAVNRLPIHVLPTIRRARHGSDT